MSEELAASISPRGRCFFDAKNFLYYWHVNAERRLIFGGRASFRRTSVDQTAAILRAALAMVHPQAAHLRIDHAWGGNVAFTFDRLPHLGEHDGIHYALGYCGSGVALGTDVRAAHGPDPGPLDGGRRRAAGLRADPLPGCPGRARRISRRQALVPARGRGVVPVRGLVATAWYAVHRRTHRDGARPDGSRRPGRAGDAQPPETPRRRPIRPARRAPPRARRRCTRASHSTRSVARASAASGSRRSCWASCSSSRPSPWRSPGHP